MRKLLLLLLACLLPLTALAEETILKDTENVWDETVHLRVADGLLIMTVESREPCQPIAVKEGFVEAARALEAQGRQTATTDGMATELRALLDDSLTGGLPVHAMAVDAHTVALMLEGPGDHRTLRLAEWNGGGYDIQENRSFPRGSGMDPYHFGGYVNVNVPLPSDGYLELTFQRRAHGWELSEVRSETYEQLDWNLGWCSLVDREKGYLWDRNEGYFYGTHPWRDFESIDVTTVPGTLEEALRYLDRSGWAVVNNPNPADRLHLRAAPDRNAASLGKFYNKTPVRVIGIEGAWSQVIIGENGLTGWMMTEYLAVGETMDSVSCAFPDNLALRMDLDACFARGTADMKAPETWEILRNEIGQFIIGVAEDEWYILMNASGQVGYAPQSWFEPGNG